MDKETINGLVEEKIMEIIVEKLRKELTTTNNNSIVRCM
jgi:hypothetical protein